MSQKAYNLKSNPSVKKWVHVGSGSTGYQGLVPSGTVEQDWEEVPFISELEQSVQTPRVGSKKLYDAYIAAGYDDSYARERSNYTGE